MAKANYIEDKINVRFDFILEFLRNAQINIIQELVTEYNYYKKIGLSDNVIMENIFNTVQLKIDLLGNKEAQQLFNLFKSTSQFTVASGLGSRNYKWVRNPGAASCIDCKERDGKIKSLEEWEKLGLPGDDNTQCHANCMCELRPV